MQCDDEMRHLNTPYMLPYRDSHITQIALGVFFLAVLAYAYFEVRGLLYGPHIHIMSSPVIVHDQYVVIGGETDHIASLSVLGAPVAVDVNGAFEVPYLLAPGLNRIIFDAHDSYGHTASKTVEIVYMPAAASTASTTASSTASTSSPKATTRTAIPAEPAFAASSTLITPSN